MKPEFSTTAVVTPSTSVKRPIVAEAVVGVSNATQQPTSSAANTSAQFAAALEKNSQSLEQTKEQLREMVDKLNLEAGSVSPSLRFQYDDEADTSVIQVFDRETEQLIRQIPSEEALARIKNADNDVFQLIDTQA